MSELLFVNTRPEDRAAELSVALHVTQCDVVELPLLELHARPWTETLAALYQKLLHVQVIVVVSPSAVRYGMQGLKQSGLDLGQLQHIRWIAVGGKTAHTLQEYGIFSEVPEVETSEGMLQLKQLRQLTVGSTVAFWRGEGGRQFMMQTLIQQGIQVLNFVLYERSCPQQSIQNIAAVAQKVRQAEICTVLITSEASWLNWVNMLKPFPDVVALCHYLVLGERLSQLLYQEQLRLQTEFKLTVLKDLKTDTIMQQIEIMQGNS